jgi:uncharacterized phage protein gp47/JayE
MAENIIDGSGIQIQSYQDILNAIINGTPDIPGMISIYGSDINVASNTPDGNLINIFALSKEDVLQLCVGIYDSFDPDQARGVALDSLAQLCGIARKGGSYTEVSVVVTATQAVSIYGLDNLSESTFTISDTNGNEFYLKLSQSIAVAGTYPLDFRAADVGYVQAAPNTITNIVSVTPGISAVNNPAEPTLIGADQETDANFRVRRQNSVSIPAQGSYYGLYAGLLSLTGLNQAVVYVNNTTSTDAKSIPAHSIWVIVDGGTAAEIGAMINNYLPLGCGMKGSSTVAVSQIDGTVTTISYDAATYQSFHATMHVTSKSSAAIDTAAIATYFQTNYLLGIYQPADITAMAAILHTYSTDLVMSSAGVAIGTTGYGSSVWPTAYSNRLMMYGTNISFI